MKALIIDRDAMFSNFLAGKIRALGHEVIEIPVKNEAIEQMNSLSVEAVFLDPTPMKDPKSIMLQIRRLVRSYPYIVQIAEKGDRAAAIHAGCSDFLAKPLAADRLETVLDNAARMSALVRRLGDESYDFPSRGGVISKSAFNQLFLSSVDRVSRYNELAHTMFFRIANYEDIKLDDGKYAADYAVSKLAQNLVRLRRQSDILAQTDINEYAILLQRPQTETESLDAAKRFATALTGQHDITSSGMTDVLVDIDLLHLPTGALDFTHRCRIMAQGAMSAG